ITSQTSTNTGIWRNLYSSIVRANDLLENLDKVRDIVDASFLNRVEAEARFLRAYFYHHLIELYGDVPLLTRTPIVEEANIGRSKKSEVTDQIIADLQFAKEYLPDRWQGADEGRISKGAASALLARVALYNSRFELAI